MNWPTAARPPRRTKEVGIAIGIAIGAMVIATAALIVGLIDLNRTRPAAPPVTVTQRPSPPTRSAAEQANADHTACEAIAPLMSESNHTAQAYSSLGPANSPEWKVGVPKFVSDTKDWVSRIQPVIDTHPDADAYFRRSMQRFIDDRRYLVADLEAGPWQPYDQTNWNDSLSALGGPLSICWDLGVKW